MTLVDERTEALCKYEGAKKDFQNLGMKAAYYLKELRQETNTLLTNKDFLSIDFKACQNCINELKQLQKQANDKLHLINNLNEVYKLD